MLRNILAGLIVYLMLMVVGDSFKKEGDPPTTNRERMFKFAVFQDFFVALSVLKMMIFEGYTICGVVERIRSSGLVTHVYLATSVVLHGTLLFEEDTTNQQVRLNPVPYLPDGLDEDQKDLFLL